MEIKFSIIVVCLNAGDKLRETVESVEKQKAGEEGCDYTYEIIVKDGGSTDGSVDALMTEKRRGDSRIRLFVEKDTGIYDAMNQAVRHATGDYVLFLNCGDILYGDDVLRRTAECILRECGSHAGEDGIKGAEEYTGTEDAGKPENHTGEGVGNGGRESLWIFYGDTYSTKNGTMIASPPAIDGFACYRNIPCHQSCFYARELCERKPYDPGYAIRADYEHFLWCFYKAGAKMKYMGFAVSAYEGGGFSESRKNRDRSKAEHKAITESYIPSEELKRYRLLMALTLAPLRSALADSRIFSGIYHGLKKAVYGGRIRNK